MDDQLAVAADFLEENGFSDAAEEVRTRAQALALAKKIAEACQVQIESIYDSETVSQVLIARAAVSQDEICDAREPFQPTQRAIENLTATLTDELVRYFVRKMHTAGYSYLSWEPNVVKYVPEIIVEYNQSLPPLWNPNARVKPESA